jgi:hypothetical protein
VFVYTHGGERKRAMKCPFSVSFSVEIKMGVEKEFNKNLNRIFLEKI